MSGEWDHLSSDLGGFMNVIGRIPPDLVSTYVQQIKLNPVIIKGTTGGISFIQRVHKTLS